MRREAMKPGGGDRARRRSAAVIVGVLCLLAPMLGACGGGGPPRTMVSILPDPTAKGGAWNWSAKCPFGPIAASSCRASGPNLGAAQLVGDEWNLGSGAAATGSLQMSVDARGALAIRGDFQSAPPCTDATCLAPSANTWVRGYPSVSYGLNQCHANTSPTESPELPLPMQVGAIPPDLVGTTTYSAHISPVTYDVAYDMWLSRSGTKKPCNSQGTLEVMVWTDYDQLAVLPPQLQVGSASIPFAVNGVSNTGQGAWSVYASNVFGGGRTAPWGGTVWLVLNPADTTADGTVSVDLSDALSSVGTILQNDYGWSDFATSYWLDTVPFGVEFGPQSGTTDGAGPSQFSLGISSYCLGDSLSLSDAGCG